MVAYYLLGFLILSLIAPIAGWILWGMLRKAITRIDNEHPPPSFALLAGRDLKFPFLNVTARSLQLLYDPDRFNRFKSLCQFKMEGENPHPQMKSSLEMVLYACFDAVMTLPLQGAIICHPKFPLRGLGLIHLKTVITVYELPEQKDFHTSYMDTSLISSQRWTEAGSEIDILAVIFDKHRRKVWEAVSTLLSRSKSSKRSKTRKPQEKSEPFQGIERVWQLPGNLGVEYARASGDWNPHHLCPVTAWPFGFAGPIAHGMYTYSRATADIVKSEIWKPVPPFRIIGEFKRPLVVPAKDVVLRAEKIAPTANFTTNLVGLLPKMEEVKENEAVSCAVLADGAPHFRGCMFNIKKKE